MIDAVRRAVTRVADALIPPGIEGGPWARLVAAGYRVRVITALSALASMWALPAPPRQRVLGALLIGLGYLPYSAVLVFAARRSQSPSALLRVGSAFADVLIVFLFQLALPSTRVVALLGYLMLTTLYASLGGWVAGLSLTGAALSLTVLAQVLQPAAPRIDAFTLIVFGAVAGSLSGLLDSASREQRRATVRLAKLHGSLRVVSSAIELQPMLRAVAAAAKESLGAVFAAVLFENDGRLVPGIVDGVAPEPGPDLLARQALASDDAGPSAVALRTGRAVVVEDFGSDPRFSRWARVGEQMGFRSMVATPVIVGGDAIGVLNTYFARARRPSDSELELAEGFAEQAATAYARATAYERERAAAERLRALDALKSEFLSTVSHELRTPLTSIEGFGATLIDRWDAFDDPTRLDLIARISRNAGELHRMIEQLLDLSRLDAGRVDVEPRPALLRDAIEDCLGMFGPALEGHPVELSVPELLEVDVDPMGFDRILGNLVVNAAKFSPPGSPIEIKASAAGLQVLVSVSDQGPGIPRESQGQIFDRFFQASPVEGGRRGTGVGLSVAKRYVELHHGRIWVASEPGRGSTFSFTLPRMAIVRSIGAVG